MKDPEIEEASAEIAKMMKEMAGAVLSNDVAEAIGDILNSPELEAILITQAKGAKKIQNIFIDQGFTSEQAHEYALMTLKSSILSEK